MKLLLKEDFQENRSRMQRQSVSENLPLTTISFPLVRPLPPVYRISTLVCIGRYVSEIAEFNHAKNDFVASEPFSLSLGVVRNICKKILRPARKT